MAEASHNPYYVAQKMVILGRTPVLLNTFADRLPTLGDSVAPDLIGPLVRFFTHLVLVLRSLGQDVPEDAANDIIKAYLHILERDGNDALVAAYAACLREGNGEQSYARFLRAMNPDTTFDQKKQALLRAQQHSLDVSAIAKETVRMILDEAFSVSLRLACMEADKTVHSGPRARRAGDQLALIPVGAGCAPHPRYRVAYHGARYAARGACPLERRDAILPW